MIETFNLLRCQNIATILKNPGGGNNVIVRYRDTYQIVPELDGKLPRTEELLVVPTPIIRVGRYPRIPLSDLVNEVAVLWEKLESGSRSNQFRVDE